MAPLAFLFVVAGLEAGDVRVLLRGDDSAITGALARGLVFAPVSRSGAAVAVSKHRPPPR